MFFYFHCCSVELFLCLVTLFGCQSVLFAWLRVSFSRDAVFLFLFLPTDCFLFCYVLCLSTDCCVAVYIFLASFLLLCVFLLSTGCCFGFFYLVHTPSSCFVGLASQGRASKGGTVRLQRRGAAPVLRSPEGVDQYVVYDSRLVCAAAVPATAITAMLLILILLTTLLASEGGAPALPLPLPPLHFLRIGFPIDVWIFDKCQRYSP